MMDEYVYDTTTDEQSDGMLFETRSDVEFRPIFQYEEYVIRSIKTPQPEIDPYFYETHKIPIYLAVFIAIISGMIGSLSSFPYIFSEDVLPGTTWYIFCVIRTTAYAIVFTYGWVEVMTTTYNYLFNSVYYDSTSEYFQKRSWLKTTVGLVFVSMYAGLYAWKWYILDELIARYATIAFFFLSTSIVYYKLISKQICNTLSSSTSYRYRRILINDIKKLEIQIYERHSVMKTIVSYLEQQNVSGFSLFIPIRNDYAFFKLDPEQLVNKYENDLYSNSEYYGVSITNILLGVSWICMWVTMIEDYGYAVSSTTNLNEEQYLWVISIVCLVLSALYILCSYNLCHNSIRTIIDMLLLRNSIRIIKRFVIKLPFYFLGGLIASTRLNSSYNVFGRIAAKYALPYSIGLTLVYSGVIIVFLLDMSTATKMISYSVKNLITLFGSSEFIANIPCLKMVYTIMTIRYYIKKAKYMIRQATDDGLKNIIHDNLCN